MGLLALLGIIIVLFLGGVAAGMYLQRATDICWKKGRESRLNPKMNDL
jgi:hypothetical protein